MSSERKLANATGLYMEGIRDGKAEEALEKYTGARYTQHSTGVADGKDAVVDAADWCFIDIFRVQDGKIVEHWDVQEKILPQEQWNNSGKF